MSADLFTESPTSEQEQVEYRDISGFHGYRVGDDGSVWSRKIIGAQGRLGDWFQRTLTQRKDGYVWVKLYRNGCYTQRGVHMLVLEAFVGSCPDGMECRHLNGNRSDNRIGNLTWGTKKENGEDRIKHGTTLLGTKNNKAKVDEEAIKEIRRRVAAGEKQKDVGKGYGLGQSAVSSICRGEIWKHVI